jgi:two-component system response regulator FixJ
MEAKPTIHVVDDDGAIRRSLQRLLFSAGFGSAVYETTFGFLEAAPSLKEGCLLLDLRMPGIDGLQLQALLNRLGFHLPIVMMTGHGDVAAAVQAMKAGAVDFIEKPCDDERLLGAIEQALTVSGRTARDREEAAAAERIATLSPREGQVLDAISSGCPNKVIAYDLGISVRTVEVHRARMLARLGTRNGAEAVRLAVLAASARQLEGSRPNLRKGRGRLQSPPARQSSCLSRRI